MADGETSLSDHTDEELIAAFQHGSEAAFKLLVGRFKNPLMNFVYRFVGDYDDSDDIVQETFVRVFRNKHSYTPRAKCSTWIYTIASNLAKSRLRQRERRRVVPILVRGRRGGEEQEIEIPDLRYAADRGADSSLKHERIQKALNSISPKYREAVVLRDIQELSYEEIARITGLNLGTVKSRIKRGRTMLQALLKDIFEE